MKKRVKINVSGRVQGVFYRQMAMEEARRLNIFGYADRTEGGGIVIEAEGEEEALRRFFRWCRKGPSLARVEMIVWEIISRSGNFRSFEVRNTVRRENAESFYFYQERISVRA